MIIMHNRFSRLSVSFHLGECVYRKANTPAGPQKKTNQQTIRKQQVLTFQTSAEKKFGIIDHWTEFVHEYFNSWLNGKYLKRIFNILTVYQIS